MGFHSICSLFLVKMVYRLTPHTEHFNWKKQSAVALNYFGFSPFLPPPRITEEPTEVIGAVLLVVESCAPLSRVQQRSSGGFGGFVPVSVALLRFVL